jgi:Tol biopolymer transport system component
MHLSARGLRALIVAVAAGVTIVPVAGRAVAVPGRPNHDEVTYVVDGKGPNHIYVSDLQGRHPSLLVKGRDPAWSPDGQWISYRTGNPQHPGGNPTRIHLIHPDGSGARLLDLHVIGEASGEAGPAQWSPDGHWLLFDTLGGIYIVRPSGNDLRKVSEYRDHLACYDLEPSWSPSGRRIVFAILCDGGNLGIWSESIDGAGRTQLVVTGHRTGFVSVYQPAWSPDGRRIVFVGYRETRPHHYSSELYTIHPNGSDLSRVTRGRTYPSSPAWSPGGAEISFSQYGHGISLIQPNGSRETHLDRIPRQACCLSWNPEP